MPNDRRHSQQTKAINLALVIVNYRTPRLVTECIESFYDELEGDSAVVIVDNASGNGSVEHLRAWASGTTVRAWCSSSSPRATEDSRLATISEFAVSKRRTICSSTAIQFFAPAPFEDC